MVFNAGGPKEIGHQVIEVLLPVRADAADPTVGAEARDHVRDLGRNLQDVWKKH